MALARAAWLERRYGARIDWRPFDLHPEYPPDGIPSERLTQRIGPGWRAHQVAMFEAHGLPVAAGTPARIPNSGKALRLGELAREQGLLDALQPRLFDAFWARDLDLGDDAVLVAEAVAVGLDEAEVRELLASGRFADVVQRETTAVLELGGSGVPAWVIDERVLVPGAQPPEVFDRIMEKLGHSAV